MYVSPSTRLWAATTNLTGEWQLALRALLPTNLTNPKPMTCQQSVVPNNQQFPELQRSSQYATFGQFGLRSLGLKTSKNNRQEHAASHKLDHEWWGLLHGLSSVNPCRPARHHSDLLGCDSINTATKESQPKSGPQPLRVSRRHADDSLISAILHRSGPTRLGNKVPSPQS